MAGNGVAFLIPNVFILSSNEWMDAREERGVRGCRAVVASYGSNVVMSIDDDVDIWV
jgi:hypothetical protein